MGAVYKACNDPDFLQEYDSVSFELPLYDTTLGRLSFVSLESCCGAVFFFSAALVSRSFDAARSWQSTS